MKNKFFGLVLFVVGLVFSLPAIAQDEAPAEKKEIACKEDQKIKENLSIYYEYYKSKNYKDAYESWSYIYENCPSAHKNIYIHGPKLLKYKYKNAEKETKLYITEDRTNWKIKTEGQTTTVTVDGNTFTTFKTITSIEKPSYEQNVKIIETSLKQHYLDELLEVYDNRLKYFPGKEGYVLGMKGSDMINYKIGTSKEAYDVLAKAYEIDGNKLGASVLYSYFTAATRLFNEKIFGDEEVFIVYDQVVEAIDFNKEVKINTIAKYEQMEEDGKTLSKKEVKEFKKAKKYLGSYETVETNVEKIIGKIATCDRLDILYGEKFEAQKGDIDWVNGGVKMMTRKKCFDSKVFFKLIDSKSKLAPDASSSRVAGLLSLSNKQYSKALKYYEEAIKLGDDSNKKADDYYKAAQCLFKLGQRSKARSYAYKAIDNRKGWGEPYILIGDMYAASANACGENAFEKKAVYWAAVAKYSRARNVDPKVSKKAAGKINSWGAQVPNKTMIFQFGYIGKPKYKIKCWINETVNVPQS